MQKSFKDLVVWQKSFLSAVEIYKLFATIRDFGFRDQIQRSSVSVPTNIAEGYSRRNDNFLKHFLIIAKGSAAETESLLMIAADLGYISKNQKETYTAQYVELQKMISGFIKKL